MGLSVNRIGDITLGHCFNPRPCATGSSNVFTNGIPTCLIGSYFPVHTCGDSSHDGVLAVGSSTVFVNGVSIGRLLDAISCGDHCGVGSPNVFAGG